MRTKSLFLVVLLLVGICQPAGASIRTASKPDAPSVTGASSSAAKKGKVNVTITFTLGSTDGGASLKNTKVYANGKSCTASKSRTSCTIKKIKVGTVLKIYAISKNKKGNSPSSNVIGYTAGDAATASEVIIPGSFAGSGMFRVGVDIQPGTYKASAADSWGGYWERLSCATGDFGCILSNQNVTGSEYVTISASDAYFNTKRMTRWVPIAAITPALATSFAGEGQYKVNFDIQPGTYQANVADSWGGYWEREACATHEFACILANGNESASTIVTILPTDEFFLTHRFGTWTKIG